ncbi:hypothetical protein [Tenacibaculum geojense]|uniref:Uncharacterized protein n=1 Tax=Tenacibaculum geojense TaxID=915352 RepID=A0ABW3JMU7_9FLAO
MKAFIIKSIVILFVTTGFTVNNLRNQTATIKATFDGFDEYGYSFLFTNEDDEEEIITFDSVSGDILKKYNLKDESLVGEEFEITYELVTVEDEDEETSSDKPVLKSIKKVE